MLLIIHIFMRFVKGDLVERTVENQLFDLNAKEWRLGGKVIASNDDRVSRADTFCECRSKRLPVVATRCNSRQILRLEFTKNGDRSLIDLPSVAVDGSSSWRGNVG